MRVVNGLMVMAVGAFGIALAEVERRTGSRWFWTNRQVRKLERSSPESGAIARGMKRSLVRIDLIGGALFIVIGAVLVVSGVAG